MTGYTHIVVGAGAAGCVVAARLSEDVSARVLVLEAGPVDSDPAVGTSHGVFGLLGGELDWGYVTTPQPGLGGRTVPVSAGRTLGGGGSINYEVWFRGHPLDYDGWNAGGMTGWGWPDVLPDFRRSEDHELGPSDLHGSDGPIPVTTARDVDPVSAALLAAGIERGLAFNHDLTGPDLDGIGLVHSNLRAGRRWSAARGYLHPAMSRDNLEVRTGCQVLRVLMSGRRATGVEYLDEQGRAVVAHGEAVVLCAGGVRSAQLLMLSGAGPAADLRAHGIDVVADLPGVGAGLQDHLAVPVVWPVPTAPTWADAYTPENVQLYESQGRGPLASLCSVGAFLRVGADAAAPDVQLLPMLTDLTGTVERGLTCLAVLLTPQSRGRVRLASTDPLATPVVDPAYLSEPADRVLMREAVRRVADIGASPVLQALTGPLLHPAGVEDTAVDEAVGASALSINHLSGTCRAGTDDEAVVTPDLQVRGLDGVWVVDSSVMPALPRGNTHAPSIMIGERGARLVAAGSASAPTNPARARTRHPTVTASASRRPTSPSASTPTPR